MKVISIMQPWATLIALREKRFETRSWATKYRGDLAIHASRKIDRAACKRMPILEVLKEHGIVRFDDLPTGMIIATCRLSDCIKVIESGEGSAVLKDLQLVSGNEYAFGDYSLGRYAWELMDVKQIGPVPVKGKLGLWEYPIIN
jgi:activating signal cointegrator 1